MDEYLKDTYKSSRLEFSREIIKLMNYVKSLDVNKGATELLTLSLLNHIKETIKELNKELGL